MSQAREIWDFLVLSRDTFEWCEGAMVLMTFRWYEGAMVFCVSIFSFCKETTVIERKQWDGNDFCRCYRCYGNIFSKVSFRKYLVTAMFKVLSQNYEAPWQRHLKNTLQLKILRTWTNIGVESATRNLTYNCMLLFLSNKPSFKIKPSVDRIIFAIIYLPFYLSIFCVS